MGETIGVAGRIHSKDYRTFWEKVLEADPWVLSLLTEGYRMPWVRTPEAYREKNNKSARDNMAFVCETVHKWEKSNFVERQKVRPVCVSPLTVSTRTLADGKVKRRLCWDGSRCVNKCLRREAFAMSTAPRTMDLIEKGDYQASLDLESAYYHIRLHEDDQTYFGFALPCPETGEDIFFKYKVLAFGISTAAFALTRVTKPLVRYIHDRGIKFCIYIDDARVSAPSKEETWEQFTFVKEVFQAAGFVLSQTKTDTLKDVSQRKVYLGFQVDSSKMEVSVQPDKVESTVQIISQVLAVPHSVPARLLAKAVGKLSSLELAMGPVVLLFLRSASFDLQVTEEKGWSCSIPLSEETKRDLAEAAKSLWSWNGYPIRSPQHFVSLRSIFNSEDSFTVGRAIPNHRVFSKVAIVAGDASDQAVCSYTIAPVRDSFYFKAQLSPDEAKTSSGHRELLTVLRTLEKKGSLLQRGSCKGVTVYWVTDSQNLVSFLTRGSTKSSIQEDVLRVFRIAKSLGIQLVPIHTSREDPRIQIADAGSKRIDGDDWGIDSQSFADLDKRYGPFSVDLFAATNNTRVSKFYSVFAMPGAASVDAFAHNWSGENAFICPPVREVIKVWKRLHSQELQGVLIIPKWRSSLFWPVLFPGLRKSHIIRSVDEFRPFIVKGDECQSVVMQGRTQFSWLSIVFNSKKTE